MRDGLNFESLECPSLEEIRNVGWFTCGTCTTCWSMYIISIVKVASRLIYSIS